MSIRKFRAMMTPPFGLIHTGVWVYSSNLSDWASPNGKFYGPINEKTITQVVEENGPLNRVVFNGDIIEAYRRDDHEKKTPVLSEVTFLNGCYMAFNCTWHELYRLWQSDFKVVGNIYENPEMLKK